MPTDLAEYIVASARHDFLDVGNLQGIVFLDSSTKSIIVSENRAADITFFFFQSTILTSAIDQRFPSTTLSLDFFLRLPQTIMSTVSTPAPVLTSGIHTPPITPKPTMVQTPASCSSSQFALDNAIDNGLNSMNARQLRQLFLNTRPSSYPASGVTTPSVNLLSFFFSHLFFYSQNRSSPQIGCLHRGDNIPWFPLLPG